jgi:hypothetical protein
MTEEALGRSRLITQEAHVCPYKKCGRSFSQAKGLNMHIGRKHKKNIVNYHKGMGRNGKRPYHRKAPVLAFPDPFFCCCGRQAAPEAKFCDQCGLSIEMLKVALTVAVNHGGMP